MKNWSYCKCTDVRKHKCEQNCGTYLSGNIVEFGGKHYHDYCLLDKLTSNTISDNKNEAQDGVSIYYHGGGNIGWAIP